jgi:HD-GYP domain-containing protein (c-di-GMP phosphodiesterase class II)
MGGIIQAMSLTIEKRDPYTAGHQRRVTKLCRAIATVMGFSWEQIQGFRMAAAIHDLGKIRVPSEILSKPGRLTENEFGIIRTHPQVGFEILKGIEFSWPIAQIVYQHHERMDGSGYPRGLSGAEILPEARILAVADVVEAMSSHRPYRPALGLERATAEIRQHSGILYDADVVDACLKAIAENKTLLEQTSPQEM